HHLGAYRADEHLGGGRRRRARHLREDTAAVAGLLRRERAARPRVDGAARSRHARDRYRQSGYAALADLRGVLAQMRRPAGARVGLGRLGLCLTVADAAAAGPPAAAPPAAPLKIGIIGTGEIGGTLARLWVAAGHEVLISSRHPDRLKPLA